MLRCDQQDRIVQKPPMTPPAAPLPEDVFLDQFLGAMALDLALRQGVIDRMLAGEAMPQTKGGLILAQMLIASGVIADDALTPAFIAVMSKRRAILEQKLRFLCLAARDIVGGLDDLLGDLPSFMGKSETFALFRYDKAMQADAASLAATRPWVDYVTALSEAEAPVLVPHFPLEGASRLLEVGGNTGVIAREALRLNTGLQAAILDLPAVCAIGREIGSHPRLTFVEGDARTPKWPDVTGQNPDAVLFKSVLHDWPENHANAMLDRAVAHLAPGGKVIVCERGAFGSGPMPFSMTSNLVFAPFYRPPAFYHAAFAARGLTEITQVDVDMDMRFHIVSGVKS
jgi:hypothetical protein